MKDYLLKTFKYNDWANGKLLEAIHSLEQKDEAIRLFSHLIHTQNKWYNRLIKTQNDSSFEWMGASFKVDELETEWERSISNWIDLASNSSESDLDLDIEFMRQADGKGMRVKLSDLMLQLNYHSIHHRAQINSIISRQGQKPPITDYIFTVLREG